MTIALGSFQGWRTLFERGKSGLQSIEAIVWAPILLLILAIGINTALIQFNESRLLRVVQQANHLLAVGDLNSEADAEDYIISQLDDMSQSLVVESVIDDGLIVTTLTIPVIDVMPTGLTDSIYYSTVITVSAQQAIDQ